MTRTGRRDDAQVHVRAGGDAEEECVHTDEVASELDVGSLIVTVGLPRSRLFAGSARKGVRRGEERRGETLAWGKGDGGGWLSLIHI